MAKIRGIKPDLWTDDDFVEVSAFARLLWLGMWNFACDNGHLQDKSKQIKMRVLPTDEVNCAELLRELEHQGLIIRRDGWITVPNLTHHQKVDRRYFSTCTKDGCTKPAGDSQPKTRRGPVVDTSGARRVPPGPRGDGDGDGELMVMGKVINPLSDKSDPTPDRFDEFWTTYDHKVGRSKAVVAYRKALKKPGVTDDLLIAAAFAYISWCKGEGKHPTFTKHASTWLNGEHWTDERVGRPERPTSRVSEHMALADRLRNPPMGELA